MIGIARGRLARGQFLCQFPLLSKFIGFIFQILQVMVYEQNVGWELCSLSLNFLSEILQVGRELHLIFAFNIMLVDHNLQGLKNNRPKVGRNLVT